ncbi:hypothetical protein [Streptosporangium sp. NPDC051022]|uniref:hypothetical protein n=1 Tax=Streptosporangium sp. NPDC051022 TaxID=3155752 RepID=UPI00341B1F47
MIAGSRGRALARRRMASWIALVVCLGLCLGWHPGDLGLVAAERQCVEMVTEDRHPVDEVPATPGCDDLGCRRASRARTGTPTLFRALTVDEPTGGTKGPEWAKEDFPVALPAGACRLILLGVSRI